MKKALCLALALLALPLGGCGARIELAFMAVCLGVDVDEAGVTLTVKSPDYGGGESGYTTLSASGESWAAAVAALYAAAPVTPQFSQLREVVIGESSFAHMDARTLLNRVDQLPGLRAHALLTVCPGQARALVTAMEPAIGKRLSRYLDMSRQHDEQQGNIPATSLSEALRDLGGCWRDPVLAWADAGGYALGSAGSAVLTRREVQLYRLIRGQSQALMLDDPGHAFGVEARGAAEMRVEADASGDVLYLRLPVYITYSLYEEQPGQAAAETLRRDVLALIAHLQGVGCDALGFGCQAVRRYDTLPHWLASGWPQRFRNARVRVEIDAAFRQQPLL